ncbi:nitroreductase family protein [Anaeromicropila herbilytica]|uniref:Nitroreductase n=1 Tax=Anaeromicropila herbilytica TaxID=2785025 RepID=A0A7R7EI37_9FIRM|nr:nitroreductase family protein [Anaeromicropila herbilytica]BCN29101.1 nitroreductase [Anaeromicropila herbilytica]
MKETFNKPIQEIIKMRYSVRSYNNKGLTPDARQKILSYIEEINQSEGIFGGRIRVKLIQRDDGDKEIKLGTYGVIKGAKDYLGVACQSTDNNLVDLGFLFEKLVLYCTSIALGTVWMGGTFSKGNFAKAMNLEENEILPIISPVGIEGNNKSILAKMLSKNSLKRREYTDIFFNKNFNTPLTYKEADEYQDALEMVRLAPSAMNKQPWRVVKEDKNIHFYSAGKAEMSHVDIGIALCHFYYSVIENGLNGEFKILSGKDNDKYTYVITWCGL